MVDNSNMPHPECLGSQKNPGTEPKTCEKGPKLGFEYLPTSKTSHCVRTACALRAHCVHGIPNDAPSITKYGSPVRLDAKIVALRPHYALCAKGEPLHYVLLLH